MKDIARFAFWIAVTLSCLWSIIAVTAAALMIFDIVKIILIIYDKNITDFFVVIIIFFQPIITISLTYRAIKIRNYDNFLKNFCRATLPLFTILLLLATFWMAKGYRQSMMSRLDKQQFSGTITWDCTAAIYGSAVNSKNKSTQIVLHLTSMRPERRSFYRHWVVQWPAQKPISAEFIPIKQGNIGGAQGLTWTATNGHVVAAGLYFNDVIGAYGPRDMEVTIVEARDLSQIQGNFDAGNRKFFTCVPNPNTYRPIAN